MSNNTFGRFFMLLFLCAACANRVRVTDISSSGIEIQLTSKTPPFLLNTWNRHPHLEIGDTLVYIRALDDTLLQRGFQSMSLKEDGKFIWIESGPDDRSIETQGIWVYDAKHKILDVNFNKIEVGLIPIPKSEKKPFSYKIEKLSKDVLKVRQVCSE